MQTQTNAMQSISIPSKNTPAKAVLPDFSLHHKKLLREQPPKARMITMAISHVFAILGAVQLPSRMPTNIEKSQDSCFPPTTSSVVRLQDGFACPDKDGGLRRVLANVAMSNGHIKEIQVRHAAMEKAYERTAYLWRDIRAMRGRLEAVHKDSSMSNQQIDDGSGKRPAAGVQGVLA